MQSSDYDHIDPVSQEFIEILCTYFISALENAKEEIEEVEDLYEDIDPVEIIDKHFAKTQEYLKLEGWV